MKSGKYLGPKSWNESEFKPGIDCHKKFPIEVPLLDSFGRTVSLKRFLGRKVVLEMGGTSSPNYVKNIPEMTLLAKMFPDIMFVVVYPKDENLNQSNSLCPGRHLSQVPVPSYENVKGEERVIFMDDQDGSFCKKVGAYPNIIYLIDESGHVEFKRFWNCPTELNDYLSCAVMDKPTSSSPAIASKPFNLMRLFRMLFLNRSKLSG